MLEIAPDFWIDPEKVVCIKSSGEDQSVIFFSGSGVLDGHTVDRDARELAEDISNATGQDLTSVFDEPEEEDESASDE